jgi:hypothetical protein
VRMVLMASSSTFPYGMMGRSVDWKYKKGEWRRRGGSAGFAGQKGTVM